MTYVCDYLMFGAWAVDQSCTVVATVASQQKVPGSNAVWVLPARVLPASLISVQ